MARGIYEKPVESGIWWIHYYAKRKAPPREGWDARPMSSSSISFEGGRDCRPEDVGTARNAPHGSEDPHPAW
jgi:hypothetical protein